jgi:hypothetical protein
VLDRAGRSRPALATNNPTKGKNVVTKFVNSRPTRAKTRFGIFEFVLDGQPVPFPRPAETGVSQFAGALCPFRFDLLPAPKAALTPM